MSILTRPKTPEQIEELKSHPLVYQTKDLPVHIKNMFERAGEPPNPDQVDRSKYNAWVDQNLWYKTEDLGVPDNPVRLVPGLGPGSLGVHGHLEHMMPVTLQEYVDKDMFNVPFGKGQGLDVLEVAPLFSGDKKKYPVLEGTPSQLYSDFFDIPGNEQLYGVSQKALDIIRKHVPANAISVSKPIAYEAVDVVPDETFYLLDIVAFENIVDVPNSQCRWDYVWGAEGFVQFRVPSPLTRTAFFPDLDISLARDKRCTSYIYCGRDLFDALISAGVTGIEHRVFS